MRSPGWLPRLRCTAGLALTGLAAVGLPWPAPQSGGVERHVRVEASAFSFSPATIVVSPGDRVTIELVSTDYVHGLHLEGYDLNLTADPGQPATVSFVADRPGSFRFHCSVQCGPLHPFMSGRLRVGPPLAFWLAIVLAVLAIVVGAFAFNPAPARARTGPPTP